MIRIGQQFAEVRRSRNLTLEEVSKATKIREDFLSAIEKGDFKALPSTAYAYGFVRNYAKFLGLPVEKSLAIFRREFDERKVVEVLPRGLANPKEYSVTKFKIGRSALLIGVVFVIVSLFLLFQYRAAFLNPPLSVETPKENQLVNSLKVEVRGRTDSNASLTIDNEAVPVNSNGTFVKEVDVFPGNTVINFRSENRFGKVSIVERKIIVKPD